MILNSENGRHVPARPNLDRYDRMKPREEAADVQPQEVVVAYGDSLRFQKEIPSNRDAAYRELCAFGVNGEVPLAQAWQNVLQDRAANDNEQSRKAA